MAPHSKPSAPLFRRGLVALNHARQDVDLLDYVAMLASAEVMGELHFVHVLPDSADAAQIESVRASLIAQTGKALDDLPAAVICKHEIRRGPLLDRLLEYATQEQADVIFVGHRQDHPLQRSLARRLAELAPCSIWLAPDGAPAEVRRILVPIDFSPRAANALGVAARLGALLGLRELTALHVYFDESRTTYEGADEQIRGQEAAAFRTFADPVDTFGLTIEPMFREGVHPANTINRVAVELDADLLVLETRGHNRSSALLLGSVAEETLAKSHAPVLIVKRAGEQVGLIRAMLERLFRSEPGVMFD